MRAQGLLRRAQEEAQGDTLQVGITFQEVAQALRHAIHAAPHPQPPPLRSTAQRLLAEVALDVLSFND